jgi:hypothetical protein
MQHALPHIVRPRCVPSVKAAIINFDQTRIVRTAIDAVISLASTLRKPISALRVSFECLKRGRAASMIVDVSSDR